MATVYVLNLGYSTASNNPRAQQGRFVDAPTANGTSAWTCSRVWFQGTDNNPVIATELVGLNSSNWTSTFGLPATLANGSSDQSTKSISKAGGPYVYVRVFPADTSSQVQQLRIAVVFGNRQDGPGLSTVASPFTRWANPLSVYDITGNAQPDGSITLSLGQVVPQGLGSYEFNVGAVILANNTVYTFGHDPDMDITN